MAEREKDEVGTTGDGLGDGVGSEAAQSGEGAASGQSADSSMGSTANSPESNIAGGADITEATGGSVD